APRFRPQFHPTATLSFFWRPSSPIFRAPLTSSLLPLPTNHSLICLGFDDFDLYKNFSLIPSPSSPIKALLDSVSHPFGPTTFQLFAIKIPA
ncbi:hypothetical protein AYI68_g3437, partial [Smittium mucronatum]